MTDVYYALQDFFRLLHCVRLSVHLIQTHFYMKNFQNAHTFILLFIIHFKTIEHGQLSIKFKEEK